MKKILLIIALAISSTTTFSQSETSVITKDGIKIVGQFISGNDTTLTIKCSKNLNYIIEKFGKEVVTLKTNEIEQLYIDEEKYVIYNGRFLPEQDVKKKEKEIQIALFKERLKTDPNIAIGNALEKSGAVSLGIGVPCLAAGVALITAGHTMRVSKYGLINDVSTKSQLLEAGYILFPIGASLTIIGIPLHIHGKKIIDMNFNYTGNGIGISMEF